MSFLQPYILAALPLIGLPILIHLINQWRYQTVEWGAMMYLLAAHRMSRGFARIRQWLILAARVLAVAGLVFAFSRPLSSGWLGLVAGSRSDTTIILLDRSPSMAQQDASQGASKLQRGRQQLEQALGLLRSSKWVLIDSTERRPLESETLGNLLALPQAEASSASAHLPTMLQAAYDYIKTNQTGRTDIWICSDLRQSDWDADHGNWAAMRDAFRDLPQQVRFHLLAYDETPTANVAVRVTQAIVHETGKGRELHLSAVLTRDGAADSTLSVPLELEIDGARSVHTVEIAGSRLELKDHRFPLDRKETRGWGRVAIPADSNLADNQFYFVYDLPPPRRAILVTEVPDAVRPLELAASISSDPEIKCQIEVLSVEQAVSIVWEDVALLMWHAALPEGEVRQSIEDFVKRDGHVMFFPPRQPTDSEAMGLRWTAWESLETPVSIERWQFDADLLARTQSGAALPLGDLQIRRYCGFIGDTTSLATLRNGKTLFARVPTDRGAVYVCATGTSEDDSNMATNAVVLYVAVQRALAAGAGRLGATRQLDAGASSVAGPAWQRLSQEGEGLSTQYHSHAGVYQADERLLAVNRPDQEDQAKILADTQVDNLFQGLDMVRIRDRLTGGSNLVQEIWRMFLMAMLVLLLVEAALCLPRWRQATGGAP